jgi:hypothetical protein
MKGIMKYVLEIEMENDVQPSMLQAETAAKAAERHLPGVRIFWMIRQPIESTERPETGT